MSKQIKSDKRYCVEEDSIHYSTTNNHYYVNYRIEDNGVIVSPIIQKWKYEESWYQITDWTTIYTAKFILQHNFIFVHVYTGYQKPQYNYLLLSDQNAGTIETCDELLSSENGHVFPGVKPTKETCGPALQIELKGGYKRWLFPHPDGQRAAWEHLCNTTTEDDLIRIAEIGMNIIENHK